MKSFNKILSAAVVATLAISVVATSASAHTPRNYKSPGGIFPALFGPFGAGAAVGKSTSIAHWTTTTMVNKNTYFIKNVVGQGNQPWVQVPKQAYNNVNLNTHIRKIETTQKGKTTKHSRSSKSRSAQGKMIVGCIMGSALGAITASVRKATALGNPPRWRSQAEHERIVASGYEKQFELTSDEAATALAFCGLGSFALHWEQKKPAVRKAVVVRARY
jgi:hypothetical protein